MKIDWKAGKPSLIIAALPIVCLLGAILTILIGIDASAISEYSPWILLASSVLAIALSAATGTLTRRGLLVGWHRSARQILPAVPMLICISGVATTWMLSGVVPVLVSYGLKLINPTFFLLITCAVCAVISVLTGSSWSTIATIGVAFMGIGGVMGYNEAWIAGAVISGAYFGDKVSPLSDTTVVASSACGVDLFKHIRYMVYTSLPALVVAMIVFSIAGMVGSPATVDSENQVLKLLGETFNLTPWVLLIPLCTLVMIVCRVNTVLTLGVSAILGLVGIFIWQPGIVQMLNVDGPVLMSLRLLWDSTVFHTGNATFDSLVETSGVLGMTSTIFLVLMAMLFGAAMIGTGMLSTLTHALTRKLNSRMALVSSTVGSGLFLNSCTADQYLSLIIGGNMFRNAYQRYGLEPRLLSRTLEDSVSVTSVLIPWNSCGVTQSAVLGVATIAYLPYCIFNYLSPVMSLLMALTGFKIKQTCRTHFSAETEETGEVKLALVGEE